jgi:hypothetical protein
LVSKNSIGSFAWAADEPGTSDSTKKEVTTQVLLPIFQLLKEFFLDLILLD